MLQYWKSKYSKNELSNSFLKLGHHSLSKSFFSQNYHFRQNEVVVLQKVSLSDSLFDYYVDYYNIIYFLLYKMGHSSFALFCILFSFCSLLFLRNLFISCALFTIFFESVLFIKNRGFPHVYFCLECACSFNICLHTSETRKITTVIFDISITQF